MVRLVVPRVIKKNKTKKLFLWTLHTNSHPHTETGLDKIKMTVSITMFESFFVPPFFFGVKKKPKLLKNYPKNLPKASAEVFALKFYRNFALLVQVER